jgi:hypothetical protein
VLPPELGTAIVIETMRLVSRAQTAFFALFFVALLPRLRRKLVSLKDKTALAWLPSIPAIQDRSGFIQCHRGPLRHQPNIFALQPIGKPRKFGRTAVPGRARRAARARNELNESLALN